MTAESDWSPPFMPVFDVAQTIWFEPLKTLRTLDLAEFRVALKDEFPLLDEQPPAPGWANNASGVSIIGRNARWPVAACSFSNRDRTQKVTVQADRLTLSWEFLPEAQDEARGAEYPGFSSLASSLAKVYREFVTTLTANSNPAPEVQRVELTYSNALDEIDVEDVIWAILQDRRIQRTVTTRERDSLVLSKHYCGVEGSNFASLQVTAREVSPPDEDQSDDSLGDNDMTTQLDIFGYVDVRDSEDFSEKLRDLHDAILQRFVALTGWTEADPEEVR